MAVSWRHLNLQKLEEEEARRTGSTKEIDRM